jgi:GxxExxY protein
MLRIQSPLSDELEALIYQTIGCCITVHRTLGPGLLETVYCRATHLELEANRVPFEKEKQFAVSYRGQVLCQQRLDVVVANQIVLEIKAIDRINPVHHAQLISYLRVSGLHVGLLMNFNVSVLQDGIKRVVL